MHQRRTNSEEATKGVNDRGLVGGQAIKEGFLKETIFTLGPEGGGRDPESRE